MWSRDVGRLGGIIGAFEELHGHVRHHRRDRVLIDELRMGFAAQKHREIIEPGHDALKLDAVDEKYGRRGLVFAQVVEKRILQILLFGVGHPDSPSLYISMRPYRRL